MSKQRKEPTKEILRRGKPKERNAMIIDNIPGYVRSAFKSACYARGTNMKEQLVKFMVEYAQKTSLVA